MLIDRPTFVEIWKAKSTKGFESLPYVVSLFSALLWLYYALMKEGNTFLLITINALGSLVEAVYVIIFIIYATSHAKKHTCKIVIGTMALWVVICVGSFMLLEGAKRALVVGWLCVGVSICVFAAPLTILCEVVKTKSVQFMPFPLSCFLTLSAIMWFVYGMLTLDLCVTVPNIVGFVLGMIQMALYQYYKERSKVASYIIHAVSEHTVNIKLSNSEVYPMDSGGREDQEHNNDNAGVEVVNLKPH
ncbi:SWEET sugar transporter, partial [Cynara cardunculus var. scolymus]